MESENNIQPQEEQEAEVATTEAPDAAVEVVVEDFQPSQNRQEARRRLNYLLSIHDRDRSDEEWDELNELEIQFAPGNHAGPNHGGGGGGGYRPMNDKRPQQRQQGQGNKPNKFQQKNKNQGNPQQGQNNGGNGNGGNNNGGNNNGPQGQHKRRPNKPHRNRQQGGQNNQAQGEGGGAPASAPAPQASEGPKSE